MIGQKRAQNVLHHLAASEKIPHALLFLSPPGAGGLALALQFVRDILCENPQEYRACGQCKACVKTAKHAHPDVHFSFPTIGTNAVSTDFLPQWREALLQNPYFSAFAWLQRIGAENKQGNINKEECNAIIKKLSLKIFEGKRKILLLWLPEYLGKEGNRLLKIIEEPPENTVFILVSENTDLILPTILSRCQIVKLDVLTDEEVAAGLEHYLDLPVEKALATAYLAEGNLFQALSLAENLDNEDSRHLLEWFRKCYKGNGPEMVQQSEQLAALGRENQKQFFQYGLHFLREMLALSVSERKQLKLNETEAQTAQNLVKLLDFGKIAEIARLFNENYYYIERNANPKLLFLDCSIKLNRIFKSV